MYGRNSKEVKEIYCGSKYMEVIQINKVAKSICKISSDKKGTGFFLFLPFLWGQFRCKPLRCLLTNYHVVSKEFIGKYIELELYNRKVLELFLDINIRIIEFFKDLKILQ